MSELVIGIDCGTTAMKGVLCDAIGQTLARAERPIPLHTPQPGWAEQDPDEVWQAFVDVVRNLVSHAPGSIASVCIGAQAGSIIPANADGVPVCPMITFLDTRATAYLDAWSKNGWRDEIRAITGWGLQPGQPLLSIAWLRGHAPGTFAQARRFIGPHDDLVRRLTGRLVTSASCGAQMPLVDRATGQWSERIAQHVGISPAHLPELRASGEAIAPVLPGVADASGLSRDTLIVNGGQDHACEALALGMTEPGALMLATGTAWVITGIANSSSIDALPAQMDLNAHVVPDRWTISTYMGGFGAIVEWWLRSAFTNDADKYAALQQALAASPPGSNGVLFVPESVARAGSRFTNLKLNHTAADMTRAIVEGIAFEVRAIAGQLREVNFPVGRLHMLGGAAKNALWRQTLADVLNVPIIACDDPYLGAHGAAQLAARGLGAGNWQARVSSEAASHADATSQARYDELYQAYLVSASLT